MNQENDRSVLDAAMADWTVARASMERLTQTIFTTTSLCLTGSAALVGYVLANNTDIRVLLIVPVFTAAFGLSVLGQLHYIRLTGMYLEEQVRPLVVEKTGDDWLLTFETYYQRHRSGGYLLQVLMMAFVFPGLAAITLAVTFPHLQSRAEWAGWLLGAAALLVLLVAGVAGFLNRSMRRLLAGLGR